MKKLVKSMMAKTTLALRRKARNLVPQTVFQAKERASLLPTTEMTVVKTKPTLIQLTTRLTRLRTDDD